MTFDHPIRLASVAGRFSIQPPLPGCDLDRAYGALPGSACVIRSLPDGRGFRLDHPAAVFAPSTRYVLTLSGGILDEAGTANSLDHHWTVTAAGAPSARIVQPADGDRGVPLDAAMAIVFSRPMRPSTTVAAIELLPQVAGTRVVRNQRDPARFVVVPGHLLTPGIAYQLRVAASATDEHGQRLEAPASVHFNAQGFARRDRGLLLLGHPGEEPSEVWLTALAPPLLGDPVPAAELLQSPRCGQAACASPTAPATAYRAAALSPDATRVAVVEAAAGDHGGEPELRILDLTGDLTQALIPGADNPAWSPDGHRLAFISGGAVHFLSVGDSHITGAPPGDPALGSPVWSPGGESVVLTTRSPDGRPHLEFVSPDVGARYTSPAVGGPADRPVFSPNGLLLAFRDAGREPGLAVAALTSTGAPLLSLRGALEPLAFADENTLLALQHPSPGAPGALVIINLSTGDSSPLDAARGSVAASVSVSGSGRRLAMLAAGGAGEIAVVTETLRGTDRQTIGVYPAGSIGPASVSLN